MKCPFCGAGPAQWLATYGASRVSTEMNEERRTRVCPADGTHLFRTTEIDSAELADLRRRAYLYERAVGSATEAV